MKKEINKEADIKNNNSCEKKAEEATFVSRIYLSFRNRFWYLFPKQAFHFLVQEWKEEQSYLATLKKWEKEEIKKQKRRHFISFFLSFVLHLLFCFFFFYKFSSTVLVVEDKILKKDIVNFDIMDGMLSSELNPVYDENSEFIIKPSTLIRAKERKDKSLTSLLEKLRGTGVTSLSSKTFKKNIEYGSQIGQEDYKLRAGLGMRKTKKKISTFRAQLWDRMKLLKSDTSNENDPYGGIMKVIDRHSFQFQECYEKGLLKDEKLSGKVVFLLKLNRSKVRKSGLELQGEGNSISRRIFTHCLFQESKKLVFSENKGNVSIKFNLIFGL